MQWSLILLFLIGQCSFIICQLYDYHYIREEKNWTEAQQHCREKHTDLATVTNMRDMKRFLNISAGNIREAWIGLYDQKDGKRTWRWSLPGVEFNESETNWKLGETTDTENQGNDNCGFLYKNMSWAATGCQLEREFLCYDETHATHKYHLIREKKTWQKAQSYCRENHTDLISGLKQLQDEELKKVMESISSEPFFGLFRDTWRWSDGSNFSFRHWKEDFNNQQYNSDRRATIAFNENVKWKTDAFTMKKPFICYDDKVILIKEKMNWEDALNYCRYHHHDLVTITNLDEQRWVQEKAKNALTDYVWMGLHYACTLDLWFWVNDRLVSYKNWASDEPMDDCDMSGAMETGGEHRWRKINDFEKFNLICFKD